MCNRQQSPCTPNDVPGFDRATGIDDPTPRREYGDQQDTDRKPHVNPDSAPESEDSPRSFQYEIEWTESYGWALIVESGCPECGNEDVFNVEIALGAQCVTYDTDDDSNPILGQDDTYRAELIFARCNDCWEIVVDQRESEQSSDE